ncbi:hypothetical protein ACWCQZ_46630 [Streptomyces sp. NPDC002285]
MTDDEIKVGLTFGGSGKGKANDLPDPKVDVTAPMYEAIIDDINARGGAGGRKIVPVWHRIQVDAPSQDAEYQSQCGDFTQDREIFISASSDHDLTLACFGAEGIPQVLTDLSHVLHQATFDNSPYLTTVPELTAERTARAQLDALVEHGVLTPDTKVGFLGFDRPEVAEGLKKGLEPALERHRAELTDTALITASTDLKDVTKALEQVKSAVLKFKSKGVDLVIAQGPTPAFMTTAEKQKYRPYYAIASPEWATYLPQNGVAEAQLRNVVGVGWVPAQDVADYKPALRSSTRQQCLNVAEEHDVELPDAATEAMMLRYCDQFHLIKQVLDTAAKPLTGDSFMQSLHKIGDTFRPASTWSAHYSGTRRDGASSVRYFAYSGDCRCFAYSGKKIAVR